MNHEFEIDYNGLTVSGTLYKGSTPGGGDDPSELNIESIGFEVLADNGSPVFAVLPDSLQEKLINDERWFQAVWEKVEDAKDV